MDKASEILRNLIVARQRGRNIDPDNLLPILLACVPEQRAGERTFTEEQFLTPQLTDMMERLSIDEKELVLECLQFLMRELKGAIAKDMN
jgi:hypothetical protein